MVTYFHFILSQMETDFEVEPAPAQAPVPAPAPGHVAVEAEAAEGEPDNRLVVPVRPLPRRAGPKLRRFVANRQPQLSDVPGVGPKARELLAANGRGSFPDLLSLFRDHTDEHGAGAFVEAFTDTLVGFGVMKRWAKVVSAALSCYPL